MEELTIIIDGEDKRGEITPQKLKNIKKSLDDFLSPHLALSDKEESIFKLQQFDYKLENSFSDLIHSIDYFLKENKINKYDTDIADYMIYGGRFEMEYGLGTVDIILTNSMKYLNEVRYNDKINNNMLLKLNDSFKKGLDMPANVVFLPHENLNEEFYDKLIQKSIQILEKEFPIYDD